MNSRDNAGRHSQDADILGDLIERFERAWEEPEPPRITDFLATVPRHTSNESLRRLLVLELVPIDLEHRWRRYARQTGDTISHHREDQDLTTALPLLPRLEDYAAQLGELAVLDRIPLELVIDEFRARLHWGDRPSIDEYFTRFEHLREEIDHALREMLAEFKPLLLKVYWKKQLVYSTRLVRPMEIGRQCPEEPPPFKIFDTQEGQRLIIAPLQETSISRRHVYIERFQADLVRMISRTAKGDIGLGSHRLRPGESAEFRFPVLLVLGEYALRLE